MIPLDEISAVQLFGLFFAAAETFAITVWSLTQTPERQYGCRLMLLTMLGLGLEGMAMVWVGGLLVVKLFCCGG